MSERDDILLTNGSCLGGETPRRVPLQKSQVEWAARISAEHEGHTGFVITHLVGGGLCWNCLECEANEAKEKIWANGEAAQPAKVVGNVD